MLLLMVGYSLSIAFTSTLWVLFGFTVCASLLALLFCFMPVVKYFATLNRWTV